MNYQVNEIPTEDFLNRYDKKLVARLVTHYPNLRVTNLEERVETLEETSESILTQEAADLLYEPINTASGLISDLKANVPEAGNTLDKLYDLIVATFAEITVATIAARNAYDAPLGCHMFVTDDGDGKWALYKATTAGINATYVKLSDPDLLNALMSASAIKSAYESNSDTNAFTNALLAKLNALPASAVSSVTTFNDQSDSYALLATDKDKHIRMTKATANNLTINDVFASGESCTVEQNGAGQVTFIAGSGVTIHSAESMVKTRVQYSGVTIIRTPTTGVYEIFGDLTA